MSQNIHEKVVSLVSFRGQKLEEAFFQAHRREAFIRASHPTIDKFLSCVDAVVGAVDPQDRKAVRRWLAEAGVIPDELRGNRRAYEQWVDLVIEKSEEVLEAMAGRK